MKIKKIVLPMVVVSIAIAGAFASNLSHKVDNQLTDRIGYVKLGEVCIATNVICTDVFVQLCTSGSSILYDLNGTDCPIPLYRKI